MQTEEKTKFTYNSGVSVIVGITMAAMVIPVAGVVLTLYALVKPAQKKDIPAQADSGLRQALVQISDKTLGAPKPDPGTLVAQLSVDDVAKGGARIGEIAKACGGFAMESSPGHWVVQVPADKRADFIKQAIPNPPPDPGGDSLIEINLSAVAPKK